jgi:hypothetical protein
VAAACDENGGLADELGHQERLILATIDAIIAGDIAASDGGVTTR